MLKRLIVLFVCFVIVCGVVHAQLKSANYEVIVQGEFNDELNDKFNTGDFSGIAAMYSKEMELRFAEYNWFFCFDPSRLGSPLRVRAFVNKGEYDAYISSKLAGAQTRPGAVYLHYLNPVESELVICHGSSELESILPHQAFIHFLRAFVPSPPYWIQEGFALYFSNLGFDSGSQTLFYRENITWLEEAKKIISMQNAAQVQDLINAVLNNDRNISIQPQAVSWALVSFLMSNRLSHYYRALSDSFALLLPEATAEQNAQALYTRLSRFTSLEVFTSDLKTYINGKKNFVDLIKEGQEAYAEKDYEAASSYFRQAMNQRPAHYAPYYYFGLIAYENKNYGEAEQFYATAADHSGPNAQIQYARGLNAAASGNINEAIRFLEEAAAIDPAYKVRIQEVINKP